MGLRLAEDGAERTHNRRSEHFARLCLQQVGGVPGRLTPVFRWAREEATLALGVREPPDTISRNALTSRLCAHFALGPFSIGFPMSFPRSLRPEGASDTLTRSPSRPPHSRGQSGHPLAMHSLPSPQQGDREREAGRGAGTAAPLRPGLSELLASRPRADARSLPRTGALCLGFRLTPRGRVENLSGQGRSQEDPRTGGWGGGGAGGEMCRGGNHTARSLGNVPKAGLPAPQPDTPPPPRGSPDAWSPQAEGHSPMALSILPRTWLLGMARPLS